MLLRLLLLTELRESRMCVCLSGVNGLRDGAGNSMMRRRSLSSSGLRGDGGSGRLLLLLLEDGAERSGCGRCGRRRCGGRSGLLELRLGLYLGLWNLWLSGLLWLRSGLWDGLATKTQAPELHSDLFNANSRRAGHDDRLIGDLVPSAAAMRNCNGTRGEFW